MNQIVSMLGSVIGGLVISFLIYLGLNFVVNKTTNTRWNARLLPYVFLAPVLVLIIVFLIVPTIITVVGSLFGTDQYGLSTFSGVKNYVSLFSTPSFLATLLNNLLWIIFVPAITVVIGLAVATLADRLGPKREKGFKTIIFLPMAISFIAASAMWRFAYYYAPPGQEQIGVLNAMWSAIFGSPVAWLQTDTFRLNSFLLMAVVVWLNAGYAMVLLSAAIKAVPEETVEAAQIDGASPSQTFFRVVAPQIRTTIVAVFITVLIGVMKIFDIVLGMTSGQFNTNVLGVEFYNQLIAFNQPGKASAVVVILIIAVIPVIVYQVKSYRDQEALR